MLDKTLPRDTCAPFDLGLRSLRASALVRPRVTDWSRLVFLAASGKGFAHLAAKVPSHFSGVQSMERSLVFAPDRDYQSTQRR